MAVRPTLTGGDLYQKNAASAGPTTTPVPTSEGGTGRTSLWPYTLVGASASQFNTTANNGFAYEKITGNTYLEGAAAWSNANSNWVAPETGIIDVQWNVANDVFDAAVVAVFVNGSNMNNLRRLNVGVDSSSTTFKVTAGDVVDFRVNSNEASRAIYTNTAPIISFRYQPNG